MYDAATGRRLAIVSDTGEAVDDRIVLQDVLP
jgi:hypothetical protein